MSFRSHAGLTAAGSHGPWGQGAECCQRRNSKCCLSATFSLRDHSLCSHSFFLPSLGSEDPTWQTKTAWTISIGLKGCPFFFLPTPMPYPPKGPGGPTYLPLIPFEKKWFYNSGQNSNTVHQIQNKWISVPPKTFLSVWKNLATPSICHLSCSASMLVTKMSTL